MPHVTHTANGWQVAATGDVYASLREALDGALAGVATHEKPAYFRDPDGDENGVYRWLPAVAEEAAPLGGVRIDATAIDEMASSLNGATRAIPIDGGSDDSPAHGTMHDPGTKANGRGHWLVTVTNESGKAEGYLWAELLPDTAREVDVGRLGEGSVHIRFGRLDGDSPRDVEYASHALLNDPGVVTLAPANSVRDANCVRRSVPMAGRSMASAKRSMTRAAGKGPDMKITPRAKMTEQVAKALKSEAARGPALDKLAEIAKALGIDIDAEMSADSWESPVASAVGALKQLASAEKILEGLPAAGGGEEAAEGARQAARSAVTEALGLAEDADEAAIVEAIGELKKKAEPAEEPKPKDGEAAEGATAGEEAARMRKMTAEIAALRTQVDEQAKELAPLKADAAKRARETEVDALFVGRHATAQHRADVLEHAELYGMEAARKYAKGLALPPGGGSVAKPQASRSAAPEETGENIDRTAEAQRMAASPEFKAQHPNDPPHVLFARALKTVSAR